jgi:hypothetical protein
MVIALFGFALAAALVGHGLERMDEARLRALRRAKLSELGWV